MNKTEFIGMIGEIFASQFLETRKIKVLKLDDSFSDTFEVEFVALDSKGEELPKRDFKVRETFRKGWEVSHGIAFNSRAEGTVEADLIQNIIVGEIAKELLILNTHS